MSHTTDKVEARVSVLNSTDVFAVLLPLGETLLAEAGIDAADVGEFRVGDLVRLKLDAEPFRKYGVLQGRLKSISADAITLEGGPPGDRAPFTAPASRSMGWTSATRWKCPTSCPA